MHKNRNQCLVIFLVFSLLISMMPTAHVDAFVLDNSVSAREIQESIPESPVPIPTDGFIVSGDESDFSVNGGDYDNTYVVASANSGMAVAAARSAVSDYLDIGNCGANLTYVLDGNGCLNITGEGGMTNYADVSAVPWFPYRSLITKVSFNGNITNIGAYAFDYCVNLTSITIPDSVISIGAYSFYACSGLRTISIPKNVTGIGAYAFYGCTGLSSVTISDHVTSIGVSAFAGCTSLTSITIPDSVTSIGEDAFVGTGVDTSEIAFRQGSCGTSLKWALLGNHQLRIYGTGAMTDFSAGSAPWYNEREKINELILLDGVTGIGAYAFEGCKELNTVTLPNTVTSIGKNAFVQCVGVTEIDLGGITEVAEHAFEKSGLTEVRISGSGTISIGNDAFSGCTSLKNVILEQCTLNTGDRVWQGCTGLEAITISACFTEMGSSLFADCTSLSQVSLTGNCSEIGSYQFSGCTALTEIIIPEGTTELGSYAFQNCRGMTGIILPDSVTSIQAGVFSGCGGLETIQFSKHLETIGNNAFQDCVKFTSLTIPDSVTSMGSGIFSGCSKLESLTLPFVGSQRDPEEASQETLFGYVFGTTSYTEASAVKQYYSDSGYSTFYLPESLVSVAVTGGRLLYGAFDHCANLERITIPDTITSIDPYVFRDCKGLEDFVIANGVTELGSYAFQNCTGIMEITFPDSLMAIQTGAFSGCTALETVKLPQNISQIADSTFRGCSALHKISMPDEIGFIGAEAFRDCVAIKNISLPANLTELGDGVFWNCVELQQINLPAGISDIPDNTFSGCAALQQIAIAGNVTGIGNYAFAKCTQLKITAVPETVTEIGQYAFSGCEAIQNIKLPQGMTQIGSHAFQDCVGLTDMEIPKSITTIGAAAFSGCNALKSLSLPFVGGDVDAESASASTVFGYIFGTTSYEESTAAKQYYSSNGSTTYYIPSALTEVEIAGGKIWYGSFSGCSHLESIRFLSAETVTDIGAKAFQGCARLIHLTLPDGVQTIGDYAFSGCTALESLSQINNLESIGSYAFQNCSSLKSISLPKTVTTINTAPFSGCSSLESMTLPFVGCSGSESKASAKSLFGYIFGSSSYTGGVPTKQYYSGSGYQTYYLPESLKTVTVTGGQILYGAFYNCKGITSLSIPDNLTEIGDYAFYNCTGIANLTLPKALMKIGNYAFAGCSGLKMMIFPLSVESIGSYAFRDCTALQDISIPEKVTSIESYLFSGCTALETIDIPDGVKTIGTYAFQDCSSVTDIKVPDSVAEIGAAAFSGCSSLESMTLPFVGYSSSQTAASSKTLFGYIFGTKSYTGGTEVKQMYSTSGTTYYIPASLKSVRITGGTLLYGAFYGCSGLTHLALPENLTEVGKYGFYQCSGLKEISLPAGVTSIGSYAFAGCSGLKEFSFPPKVSSIESFTFSGCTLMDQVAIPQGITEIGASAFQNCSNLTHIIVPDSVTTMGADVFSGCSSLKSMTLPFVGYSGSASSASAKTLFGYIFGTVSYKGGMATKQYYSSSSYKTYYIPASLNNVMITGGKKILYGTFYGCSGLNRITLPETITGIGQKAFYQCTALSEITIPQNVTSLEANAFADCTGMKYVTFSGKALETIASTAFTGVTATVFYPVSDVTWNDIIGNQYGGNLTWQSHTHSYQPVITVPSCTEQGYTTYQCSRCNNSYVSDYVNALGHISVVDTAVQATCTQTGLTEGSHCSVCGDVIIAQIPTQKKSHQFTEYVSNKDASYEQDGTMTAKCNLCQQVETITDSGSKLIDENKPVIEIIVGTNHWTGFFHAITFDLFFKDTQTATIQAADEEKLLDGSMVNRLDSVYYYISDTEIKSQDLEQVEWKKYTNTLTLSPDKKYIVYAKAVDRSKNTTYASSAGMIVDHTAPVMDGISDGQTYCEKAVFTVKDLSLRSVTDNGVAIEAADGLYTIAGDDKTHRIIATDNCGNTTEADIVVAGHHMWKEPVFSWSDEHKSCMADYACSRDGRHVAQVKCTVQAESLDATCIKAGKVVYTAIAVLDGVVKTDQQTVSGTALGHDYIPEFMWSADRSACTVTLTCQRAGCTGDTTGHHLGGQTCMVKIKTTAATCISQGKKEVVASLLVEGVEYRDIYSTEVIPVDPGNHVHTQIFNQREATCLTEGATGDVYCLDCNKIVEKSTAINQLAHVWDDGQITKAASCSETGILLHTCTNGCGTVWEIEIPVDTKHHGALRIVGAKEPTATETGYTGDTYCDDCKKTVVQGAIIPAAGDSSGMESPSPTPGNTGSPSPTPGNTGSPSPTPGNTGSPSSTPGNIGSPSPTPGNSGGSSVLAKGTVFVVGKLKYKVTNAANGKNTVAVKAPKSKTVKSLTIPDVVKVQGQSYQVTAIAASAFQKCSKLKKITIGKNITVIGKKAFYQTKKLKQITILSTKITSVGKNALKGIYKKAVLRVPKKKRKKYKKLFRNKGQKNTVRIR